MKLSVIVPVYNMAEGGKLEFCMDSLVGQTVADMEIIAVDDASTDQSPDILRGYEKKYPDRVRVVSYSVNRRQGGAKNEGMRAARGDWIGFVDSDDWVAPDCYEKLLRRAEETGADLVGCDYSLVTEHTFQAGRVVQNNTPEQTGELDAGRHKSLFLRPGSMVIKIYKASVLQENHLDFPEGIFYEDNCAGSVWSLYFKRFEKVEEPLYFYYQHEGSTVHRITESKCLDRMRAAELLLGECEKRGFLEEYRAELEYRFAELYYAVTLFSYLQGVGHPRLSFVRGLRRGILERFPGFYENVYYRQYTGLEEQRLIALHLKSNLLFFWYYRLKSLIWKMRSR